MPTIPVLAARDMVPSGVELTMVDRRQIPASWPAQIWFKENEMGVKFLMQLQGRAR